MAPPGYTPKRERTQGEGFSVETKAQSSEVVVERRRFTVQEYHKMAAAGILHEDDRVELIGGEIIEMSPIGDRHVECVNRMNMLLANFAADKGYVVSVQNPLRLGEGYEPQPDLVLLGEREGRTGTPRPEDVLLLIEVSDTTLRYDQEVKLPLYARSGIPEVWIVDLTGGAVERHNVPSEGGYRRTEKARRKDTLGSERFPGFVLQVDAVLV